MDALLNISIAVLSLTVAVLMLSPSAEQSGSWWRTLGRELLWSSWPIALAYLLIKYADAAVERLEQGEDETDA